MRKIANFILGTIVCLTVLGIIMFFTLYISLIIANENPPSDDAMFRMIQKTYGVDVTQYSPDVLYKSYDTNIREDYWAMLLNIKVTPHNSAARLAMSFPPSAACKFLDLHPVNLRNLHLHLTKNPFASRPPHLCGVTLINSSGAGWTSPRKSSLMSGKNFRGAGLSNVPLLG